MSRPCVFFDRDDTLIACRAVVADGDLGDPALVRLLPGAREAVGALKEAGFAVVVVSNQGGVARGRYDEAAVRAVNRRLSELLDHAVDAFYYCPYHPRGVVAGYDREHPWRKPSPGMLLQAARDLDLDLSRSWIVGDAARDCEAGLRAGCKAVLLAPPASAAAPRPIPPSVVVVDGLAAAAALILRAAGRPGLSRQP